MKNIIRTILIICIFCAVCLTCSCFKPKVSIIFDPCNGAEPTTVSLKRGSFEAPDTPKKSGYAFGGWFYDKDVWQDSFSTSDVMSTQNDLNATVYAKWDLIPLEELISFENATYTYDGSPKTLEVTGLVDGMSVEYNGKNTFTNAGVYEVYATVTHVDGQKTELYAELTIEKLTYDMSGVTFNDKDELFTEGLHSIYIEGELPEGVTVEYVGNNKTTPGTHTVTAIFKGDTNYNSIPPMTAKLTLYNMVNVTFVVNEINYEKTYTVRQFSKVSLPPINHLLAEGYAVRYWRMGDRSFAAANLDSLTINENSTVYAELDKRIYIDYELDGGTRGSYSSPNEIWLGDFKGTLDLGTPKKSGYNFVGWFLDAELTTSIARLSSATLEEVTRLTVYAKWSDEELPGFKWQETSLIFQMTDNSNKEELSSGCKRYLAGEDESFFESIDEMITERNAEAYKYANVYVTYDYLPNTTEYGWNKNVEFIFTAVNSQSKDRPDMFCNFITDMVSTSLKGSFANLYSTSRGTGALYGANYFDFADAGFQDNGKGYMYEYMQSLTLSKFKMYCLASDYFIDTVRAFMVVPVNVELLNSIGASQTADAYNSDRDGDGDFDINDFYMLVKQKKWNYNTLADFCAAIFRDEGEANAEGAEATLSDRVGFALSSSDFSAAGMLYTTSVVIIHRDWDDFRNDYTYYYPEQNQDLYAFCDSLKTLFGKTGVISVSDSASGAYGGNALQAIRNRFSVNKILFGGVICVGSLEYEEYQAMNETGEGFGVVPVPLYRSVNPETGLADSYLTQIHNVGRIGGISATTEKFAQCTAFLDFLSTHSSDIIEEYYKSELGYVAESKYEGSDHMLSYVRSNVGSNFDMIFDDVVAKFFNSVESEANKNKWHVMIANANYRMTTMETEYDRLYDTKESYIQSLVKEYDILPD